VAWVTGDEGRVLGHALPDLEAFRVELSLQLSPEEPVSARLGEAFPEQPDGGGVGDGFRVAEEPAEADAVRGLSLHLGVAEAVPCLEDQHLHHHHRVDVGSASLGAVVGVEVGDYGFEGLPVYEGFYFCEAVAQLLYGLVKVSLEVGSEGVHVVAYVW